MPRAKSDNLTEVYTSKVFQFSLANFFAVDNADKVVVVV